MNTPFINEFATLTLSKTEVEDFYRALIAKHIVENALRIEQGLEAIDPPLLLQKMETLLGITADVAHNLLHQTEDELWAHAWYLYTDEWAWFRAEEEVKKGLSPKKPQLKHDVLERLIEDQYHKNFERYIAEVDMRDHSTKKISPRSKRTSK